MGRFIFSVDDGDMQRLRDRSDETGAPMSYYVRRAIHDALHTDRVPIGVVVSGNLVSGMLLVGVSK